MSALLKKENIFKALQKFYTKQMAIANGLYTVLVVNCVINAILSFTAIVLNIITIQALRKTSSLSKTLKTLLLSLAISDVGVGLVAQPLYVASLAMKIEQNTNNIAVHTVEEAYLIPTKLFGFASYFGVVLLTVDRFLAIHLHLRYQELVTYKRVVAVVISVWLLSALISFLSLSMGPVALSIVLGTILVVWVVITGILYCKIYAAVRHHTNQMHALQIQQVAQNEDMANAARQTKTALATFYVYVVFLACYLPISCVQLAMISGETALLSYLCYFTLTLVYLNSSLNPLIYCWKMRYIRQTVMEILRNILAIGQH